jgi:hypothetical protein
VVDGTLVRGGDKQAYSIIQRPGIDVIVSIRFASIWFVSIVDSFFVSIVVRADFQLLSCVSRKAVAWPQLHLVEGIVRFQPPS